MDIETASNQFDRQLINEEGILEGCEYLSFEGIDEYEKSALIYIISYIDQAKALDAEIDEIKEISGVSIEEMMVNIEAYADIDGACAYLYDNSMQCDTYSSDDILLNRSVMYSYLKIIIEDLVLKGILGMIDQKDGNRSYYIIDETFLNANTNSQIYIPKALHEYDQ